MTSDSKNYSGPGAVGAVPLPGRNAIGMPQTPGQGAAGVDGPPNSTLPPFGVAAVILGLGSNATAAVGPTCLDYGSGATFGANGSLYLPGQDILVQNAYAALNTRAVVVSYGTVAT
jgi:hypothetical protein